LKPPSSPGEPHHDEKSPTSPSDPERETNGKDTSIFGKKFRMGMSFGSKKRAASANAEKPVVVDDKNDDERSSISENSDHMRGLDHNLRSVIQRIRNEYDRAVLQEPLKEVESLVTPSLPNETPVLKIPPATSVILQTEAAGGYADQYRGTVGSVGEDARFIEERAPTWLGELLLRVCSSFHPHMYFTLIPCRIKCPTKNPSKSLSPFFLTKIFFRASLVRTAIPASMPTACFASKRSSLMSLSVLSPLLKSSFISL